MLPLEAQPALLAGYRQGDTKALTAVYRAYVDDVARTIRRGVRVNVNGQPARLGANPAEADVEVLLQETFIRAFSPTARESYDGVRPFGAYLATIARNVVIDRARSAQRHAQLTPLDDEHELADADPENPLWRIEEAQLRTLVDAAVAALPERERAIYRLRYEQDLTQREIATQLGLAPITVRRLDVAIRHRILEHLRHAGHLQHVAVGIPVLVRDRSSG